MQFNPNSETLEIEQLLANIRAIQLINQDDRIKEIGDKVMIWDYSSCFDKNTGEHYHKGSKIENKIGIVIATNLSERVNYSTDSHFNYNCDLFIHYEDGTEVYACSEHVRMN